MTTPHPFEPVHGSFRCATCGLEDDTPGVHVFLPEFDTVDLHTITERADGPDLHDLVHLIEYLREHAIPHMALTVARMTVQIRTGSNGDPVPDAHRWVEGEPHPEAHFVGPDGTVYDANREAL